MLLLEPPSLGRVALLIYMNQIFYNGKIEDTYIDAILKEIYRERVYDRFLMGKDNITCLEVGANIGLVTQYLSRFSKQVFAVEPAEQHFGCLTEMIKHNNLDNVAAINKAISDKVESVTFYHNQNSTMYSMSSVVNDGTEAEIVEAVDMHTLFKDNKIGDVDFMKLDVEGSEFDVIMSVGFERVVDKIKSILIEYHTWTQRNPNQMFDVLKHYGFNTFQVPAEATLIGGTK